MKPSRMFKVLALTGLAVVLGACEFNYASYSKSSDGSVQIVDSHPDQVPEVLTFYRVEGRQAAKVCAQYGSSESRVMSEIRKLGYVDAKFLGTSFLKKKSPEFGYSDIRMNLKTPCVFGFSGGFGRSFFEGATASLMELGYSKTSSDTWARGSKKVKLTGSIWTNSSGGGSSVTILPQ